jgi:allantoin racemase
MKPGPWIGECPELPKRRDRALSREATRMRIWHQSMTVLDDIPAYRDALEGHLRKITRPDTSVVLHGLYPGTYPADYPVDDLAYPYLASLHSTQWVAGALNAQQQGFDAYAMCTLPNPMIREIRTLVDIPVTGYGEAAAHIACMLGQRFGIMTFVQQFPPMYLERNASYGLASRCAGAAWTGFGFRDVLAGYTDPEPLIERFRAAVRKMVKEQGADVIIAGSVPLTLLLAINGVHRVDDVPIIDGLAATIKMAEMMVDLRKFSGMTVSRQGYFNAAPSPERLQQAMKFYGVDKFLGEPD